MKFSDLLKVNVNDHVEKKGKFTYLSWTFAVAELRKADPAATWEVVRFDGKPFLSTECGYFVEVAVTVDGVTLSQIHPVLDNNNRPIETPNSFQINTSIQRCLVKAIALHGLGLYIYAGEDLPDTFEPPRPAITLDQAKRKIKSAKNQVGLAKIAAEIKPDCEKWLSVDEYEQVKQEIKEMTASFKQAAA